MSSPAPPLPPPTVPATVPRTPSPPRPPPPPPQRPSAVPHAPDFPSAPFPSSPSSLDAVPQPHYDPDAVDDIPTSSASDDDARSADSSPRKKKMPLPSAEPTRRRKIRLACFGGHSVAEAGRSVCLPTTLLLLFRLAVSAFLVGTAVFYILTGAFSLRLYSTWAYIGLAIAFLPSLTCSLLEILRDGDADQSAPADEEVGGQPAEALLPPDRVDSGWTYFLAQLAVPLYQVFVSVTLFGAVVFWAAIFPEQSADFDFPLLALNVVAPAVAAIDFFVSFSMNFRLVYVALVVFFNAAYAAALFAFYKMNNIYVYNFLNPSQPKGEFVAKGAGLAGASIGAALLIYALPTLRTLLVRRQQRKKDKEDDVKSVSEKNVAIGSDDTSDSSQGVQSETHREPPKDGGSTHEFDEDEVVVEDMDSADEKALSSCRSIEKRDRRSLPISKRPSSLNTGGSSKRWYRSSTSGRMQGSVSGVTYGDEEWDMRTVSQWDDLDLESVHAKPEDEYFTMPGVYNGGREEVVKLTPIMRLDSNSRSRQFARSGSGRQLFRSGSGRQFVRSASGRAVARAPSVRRSDSESRPGRKLSNIGTGGSGESAKRGDNDQPPV